jgi:hypothetical protein
MDPSTYLHLEIQRAETARETLFWLLRFQHMLESYVGPQVVFHTTFEAAKITKQKNCFGFFVMFFKLDKKVSQLDTSYDFVKFSWLKGISEGFEASKLLSSSLGGKSCCAL